MTRSGSWGALPKPVSYPSTSHRSWVKVLHRPPGRASKQERSLLHTSGAVCLSWSYIQPTTPAIYLAPAKGMPPSRTIGYGYATGHGPRVLFVPPMPCHVGIGCARCAGDRLISGEWRATPFYLCPEAGLHQRKRISEREKGRRRVSRLRVGRAPYCYLPRLLTST